MKKRKKKKEIVIKEVKINVMFKSNYLSKVKFNY